MEPMPGKAADIETMAIDDLVRAVLEPEDDDKGE